MKWRQGGDSVGACRGTVGMILGHMGMGRGLEAYRHRKRRYCGIQMGGGSVVLSTVLRHSGLVWGCTGASEHGMEWT